MTRCSPEQGVPWWCNSGDGDRQWWLGGVAEGVGKVIEGAHGVGAEVGRCQGGREGPE
jgi:hypothetical protein